MNILGIESDKLLNKKIIHTSSSNVCLDISDLHDDNYKNLTNYPNVNVDVNISHNYTYKHLDILFLDILPIDDTNLNIDKIDTNDGIIYCISFFCDILISYSFESLSMQKEIRFFISESFTYENINQKIFIYPISGYYKYIGSSLYISVTYAYTYYSNLYEKMSLNDICKKTVSNTIISTNPSNSNILEENLNNLFYIDLDKEFL